MKTLEPKTIYKKTTEYFTATIQTLPNDKYSKYVAIFDTAKGITPRSYVAFPFNSIEGCHAMFKDMFGKMKKYLQGITKSRPTGVARLGLRDTESAKHNKEK